MQTHPTGLPAGDGTRSCRDCAWARRTTDALRCVASASPDGAGPDLSEDSAACAYFEALVHCDPCGACCREAFDSVPVGPDDAHTASAHPELIREQDGWRDLQRVPTACGTKCVALRGDGVNAPFRCAIYADRPSACSDLEPGSWNCWFARKRVGLWPPAPAR